MLSLAPKIPERSDGRGCVGQELPFEFGVHPGASNDLGAAPGSDSSFVDLDPGIDSRRINQTFIGQKAFERFHAQRRIRGNRAVRVIIPMIMMVWMFAEVCRHGIVPHASFNTIRPRIFPARISSKIALTCSSGDFLILAVTSPFAANATASPRSSLVPTLEPRTLSSQLVMAEIEARISSFFPPGRPI